MLLIQDFEDFKQEFPGSDNTSDVEISYTREPVGIIDAWKLNDEYKLLKQGLNIKKFNNKKAIILTETQIKRFNSNQENIFEI